MHLCKLFTLVSVNLYCPVTLICLIVLINHIAQLLLIRKFYCFRPGLHIFFKYARHNHLRCPMMEKYLSERSLTKHSCSWRDKLIVLWTLNRQAKIFSRISYIVCESFLLWLTRNFHFGQTNFLEKHSNGENKSLTTKEKVSRRTKLPSSKRIFLTIKQGKS